MKTKIIGSFRGFILSYPAVLLQLALMLITRPYYYADSYEYAHTIMDQEAGKNPSLFLEAGHILWRPLGMLIQIILNPALHLFFPQGEFARVSATLILVVLIFSALGTIYFYRLLRLFPISEQAVQAVMILYVLSVCVLNYSQTGTSYIAGLSLLTMGLFYILRKEDTRPRRSFVLSGMILGTSVFFWMPYFLALPAAVLTRPMIYGWNKRRIVELLEVVAGCLLIAIIFLFPVILYLHLVSIQSAFAWMFRSSHNYQASGASRTFFGLVKLLFFSGQDALSVKRFLFHDPYYPVSLARLALRLWKVELFYTVMFVALIATARRRAFRPYLAWIAVGILPNIILSVRWDGAALERHMPLLVFFFIGLALWFEASSKKGRLLFVMLIVVAGLANISGVWYATNQKDEAAIDLQIEEIWPRLKPSSMVSVLSSHTELAEFQGIHPFDNFNQSTQLRLYSVVPLGFATARYWKQTFADSAKHCWYFGGDVWVSKYLLRSKPEESWYWVEHADPGVSWNDVSQYFRGLHYSDSTLDFYLLQPF